MKAVVKIGYGPGLVELKDVPEPHAEPGQVVVRVAACGVCGTDLHIRDDEFQYWPPVTLGHEYVGRIEELGSGVMDWRVGDRVVGEQATGACGRCFSCRTGATHLCPDKRSPGWGIDGAFAPLVALSANLLHSVPVAVSTRAAAVTEPTAISLTGVDRAGIRPGESVVVIGPGSIGLLSAMIARASGAGRVLVVGRSSSQIRLELAKSMGFEILIDDSGVDVSSNALDVLGGEADVAIEASGSAVGVTLALECVRRLGRVVCVGLTGRGRTELVVDGAMSRSLTVHFSISSEYSSWNRALALMASGGIDPTPLTNTYALGDWERAFADVATRSVVKALILPNGSDVLEP